MGIRLVAPAHCFERFHTKHYESDMSRFPLQGPTRLSSLRICMSKYSSGGEVETPSQKLKEIRIPFSIVSVAHKISRCRRLSSGITRSRRNVSVAAFGNFLRISACALRFRGGVGQS